MKLNTYDKLLLLMKTLNEYTKTIIKLIGKPVDIDIDLENSGVNYDGRPYICVNINEYLLEFIINDNEKILVGVGDDDFKPLNKKYLIEVFKKFKEYQI